MGVERLDHHMRHHKGTITGTLLLQERKEEKKSERVVGEQEKRTDEKRPQGKVALYELRKVAVSAEYSPSFANLQLYK